MRAHRFARAAYSLGGRACTTAAIKGARAPGAPAVVKCARRAKLETKAHRKSWPPPEESVQTSERKKKMLSRQQLNCRLKLRAARALRPLNRAPEVELRLRLVLELGPRSAAASCARAVIRKEGREEPPGAGAATARSLGRQEQLRRLGADLRRLADEFHAHLAAGSATD